MDTNCGIELGGDRRGLLVQTFDLGNLFFRSFNPCPGHSTLQSRLQQTDYIRVLNTHFISGATAMTSLE